MKVFIFNLFIYMLYYGLGVDTMDSIILIKYGELTTKKDNRKMFINILTNFLEDKLKDVNVNLILLIKIKYLMF